MGNTGRRLRYLLRRMLRALGRASGTSHQIALGVAIGFFVAWLPIVGIQMIVAVIICRIFRANIVVPIFPVWITNPVTMVPIYSFNYWIGWLIVGGPDLEKIVTILRKMITPPSDSPVEGIAGWWAGVKNGFAELAKVGWDLQLPLWLGCILVGLTLAIPSYYISKIFVESFREGVHRKLQARRERRLRQRYNPELTSLMSDKRPIKKSSKE